MRMKPLTLSIVIPFYNEENHVKACLDAIARQTVAPDEVIIVDNNCTDRTIAIAKQFTFITVVQEDIQGMIPARNKGFEVASSDLIARIDADGRLAADWVERAKALFADQSVQAAAGLALAKTFWSDVVPRSVLWSLMYFWWTEAEFGIPILWGANMVMRRGAWEAIKSKACLDDTLVHEDQDLSYLLAGQGRRVIRSNNLLISTDSDSYHDWEKFSEYVHRRFQTRRYHQALGTLARPQAIRLNWPQRILRYGSTLLPGVIFIVTSPILYLLKFILPLFAHPDPAPAE